MTEPDHIDEFFRELGSRGHDPLLDRLEGTGRFEVCEGGRMEQWLVSVKGGYVSVSRGGGDADWVMRAEREVFGRIISGRTGALAAFIRGTLIVSILDPTQRFGLITRLFAGPPEARGRRRPAGGAGPGAPDQGGPDQGGPGAAGTEQAAGQAGSGGSEGEQAGAGAAAAEHVPGEQIGPDRAGAEQAAAEQAGSGQAGSEQRGSAQEEPAR